MCKCVPSKPETSLPQTASSRSFPKSSLSQTNTNIDGSMGPFLSNLGNILGMTSRIDIRYLNRLACTKHVIHTCIGV